MRFTEKGPDVPNDLLDARDTGGVVFFCGAGISIPAGLPSFLDLTVEVARRLRVSPKSDLGRIIAEERDRKSTSSSSRLASFSLDRIFSEFNWAFGPSQVEQEVAAILRSKRIMNLDNHRALVDLARGVDGRVRLVTTNFDRLFEAAVRKIHVYQPPELPGLSHPNGFDGIVHLHGVLPSALKMAVQPLNLVLSSGDFGRAYLSDGWATDFIRDLLDRYTVVLVGYSADDPPIRYLLEGLNLSGRLGGNRLFAFTSDTSSAAQAEWRERGVITIGYDPSDNHSHFWQCIHGWAMRARNPLEWRRSIISIARLPPTELRPFQRGQVVALCSSKEGADAFSDATPPLSPEWLCVFDAYCRYWKPGRRVNFSLSSTPEIDPQDLYGLDGDPKRPEKLEDGPPGIDILTALASDNKVATETGLVVGRNRLNPPLNSRLSSIARWIVSVMDTPTVVWWAASRGWLHPQLHQMLSWRLEKQNDEKNVNIRKAWHLILESNDADEEGYSNGWYAIRDRILRDGWTGSSLRAFSKVIKPRIVVRRPWQYPPIPPTESEADDLNRIAQFEVTYPKALESPDAVPNSSIISVIEIIRQHLELGAALENECGIERERLPTLHPENKPGTHYDSDREVYYLTFAALFRRLINLDKAAARAERNCWKMHIGFFQALSIWTLADCEFTSAEEAAKALDLLDREAFWKFGFAREVLWAIRAQWPAMSLKSKRNLEARILEGPSRYHGERSKEFLVRRSIASARRLAWLQKEGLQLSKSAIRQLRQLKSGIPDWTDDWATDVDDSYAARSSWVKKETDPESLFGLPDGEIIAKCDELSKREYSSFTEYDPFRGLVKSFPERALSVLLMEAQEQKFPSRYWRKLFSDWPEDGAPSHLVHLAKAILSLPSSTVIDVRFDLSRWIEKFYEKLEKLDGNSARECFDYLLYIFENENPDALKSALGGTSVRGVTIPSNRMGMKYAINSLSGHFAQALVDVLFSRQVKQRGLISNDIASRWERLLALPGEGGSHAVTVVCQQLHPLYQIDPSWSRKRLFPYFDPACPLAEAAWSGFLAAQKLEPKLFVAMKSHFLGAIATTSQWTDERLSHLAQHLILALYAPPKKRRLLTFAEAHEALRGASDEVRLEALRFLRKVATKDDAEDAWSRLIVPFFKYVWPRERRFQSSSTAFVVASLLASTGEKFPAAVKLLAEFLVPSSQTDFFIHSYNKASYKDGSEDKLLNRYPTECLIVLSRMVDVNARRAPYGLGDTLSILLEAAPELKHDERWRRLYQLTLK